MGEISEQEWKSRGEMCKECGGEAIKRPVAPISPTASCKTCKLTIEAESKGVDNSFNFAKYTEAKKKKWNPNPWAVCNSTVDKDKNPDKFERCVKKVKKEQS